MMNCLPRELSNGISLNDLSLKYSIRFKDVLSYLKKWESKKLTILEKLEI